MSLHPQAIPPIPEETARVAHAVFPKGNVYMKLRDELGTIYHDHDFADLFPRRGQPAEAPWRLALVTVIQYAEGLTDRQAVDAVRRCIDVKYALSLDLTDPGFDFSILSEFRSRLLAHGAEHRLFEILLEQGRAHGWLKARGKQRTDSTHVLAAIRTLNRLESVGETMRHALNVLAEVAPDWLLEQSTPEWGERYSRRFEDYRLPKEPGERTALAETIGADGRRLLTALSAPNSPAWLRAVPAVETLRRVWVQQYYADEHRAQWRSEQDLPPAALLISSPYDPDARYSVKRTTMWTGYKVHMTETCEDDEPHLIIHTETTLATTPDNAVTDTIHHALEGQALLPHTHLVDAGYLDAAMLVTSRSVYEVDMLGPVSLDGSWQAQAATGFDVTHFHIDWAAHRVSCPASRTSRWWMSSTDRHGKEAIRVKFAPTDCQGCPLRLNCTRGQSRTLTLRPNPAEYQALHAARQRQSTPEFREQYAKRAGVEGTISQAVRVSALRRARYMGLKKVRLQASITAAALNLLRMGAWLAEIPHAHTPTSRFVALIASAQQQRAIA